MPRWPGAVGAGAALALALVFSSPTPAPADTQEVALRLAEPDEHDVAPIFDHLAGGDVLRVSVTGAGGHAEGTVQQCRSTERGYAECTNRFPVQFDANGVARFQYQLVDPGGCGPDGSCALIVEVYDSRAAALGFLVFGTAAPSEPTVVLSPPGPYAPGDPITVTVGGMVPGTTAVVGFCGVDCSSRVTVRADGTGRATATLTAGARCGKCGVRIVAGPRESFTRVRFVALPGASPTPRRLALWLTLALAMLLAAWRIGVAIDWRPPSEAATPELDRAVLSEDV